MLFRCFFCIKILIEKIVLLIIPTISNNTKSSRIAVANIQSRKNIHHHYDLGNDFYRLWLDDEMTYTCAYFTNPGMSLEEAQVAKMDHVCKKLRLRSGEKVVEAGCGWGGFARHMALNYGVRVCSYNISSEQIEFAKTRARKEGFQDRVEYILDDYRNIKGRNFDVFVSIGMLEHVGRDHYKQLGRVIDRVLDENGRGLIHSIGKNRPEPTCAWTNKRLFPGGYSPSLKEMMEVFEEKGFSVTDVENLRLHYALTLDHWLERYEKHLDWVKQRFDEFFVRAWRLYLAGASANFSAGALQLFQVLFTRPTRNDIPWTRADLYRWLKLSGFYEDHGGSHRWRWSGRIRWRRRSLKGPEGARGARPASPPPREPTSPRTTVRLCPRGPAAPLARLSLCNPDNSDQS